MYRSYFGLAEAPFSIAPDPRYLYMSQRHQEALAHLLYGVNGGGGFVLLTGEVGTGKTTVCRCMIDQIPANCDVAYIFNPRLTVAELLSTICAEFGIACPPGNNSIMVHVDRINSYLLDAHARGRHEVLVIDEAQNLSAEVLEQLRLLTNLETNQRKLLQIILIGQPELATMLARTDLRQLAQRIIARYHLEPLNRQEVAAYVQHRLGISGTQRPLFPAALTGTLYRLSGGIPRVVNLLCDRALLGAYVQNQERVNRATLLQAAREVLPKPNHTLRPLLAGISACILLALLYHFLAQPVPTTGNAEPAMTAREAVKPAPASPTALEWPSTEVRRLSKRMAYTALFRAWGANYQEGDECRQAEELGMRCLAAQGNLEELRQLNRPAVMLMRDTEEFYATLMRIDNESATFAVGTTTRKVPLAGVAEQWSGYYTLLQRIPDDTHRIISRGDRGADVAWLDKRLAQVSGKAWTVPANPEYDDNMVHLVKQFQLAHGLVPDGVAGTQTMVRLADATDLAAPRLSREQGK